MGIPEHEFRSSIPSLQIPLSNASSAADEELIRSYSKTALASYGYNVLLARDGAEAIQLFQEKGSQIGLVLLDVAMPGMDGSQTLERIRQIRSDVPVVVCSGFGDMEVEAVRRSYPSG